MDDLVYWVWLSLICGPASIDAPILLYRYPGGAREIYELKEITSENAKGINSALIGKITGEKSLEMASYIVEFCRERGYELIPSCSERYPARLRSLPDYPPLIYARGKVELMNAGFTIGAVGTRSMTDYGKSATFDIVRKLCLYDAVNVSGAAYGVDAAAHKTALYFGCKTIAVLGTGIDVSYPRENHGLIEYIAKENLVISEFPPGTRPYGGNFPKRNRLISGLSDAVVVTEADMKSGALITARLAMRQGKLVYAVPGNIDSRRSAGANRLIREGARICTRGEDIAEDLNNDGALTLNEQMLRDSRYTHYDRIEEKRNKEYNRAATPTPDLDRPPAPEQREVYLNQARASQDELVERAGLIVNVEKRRAEREKQASRSAREQSEISEPENHQQSEWERRSDDNNIPARESSSAGNTERADMSSVRSDGAPSFRNVIRDEKDIGDLLKRVKTLDGVDGGEFSAEASVGTGSTAASGEQTAAFGNTRRRSEYSETAQRVLDAMTPGELYNPDRISELSGLAAKEVLAELTMLELDELIESLPGGLIRRKYIDLI